MTLVHKRNDNKDRAKIVLPIEHIFKTSCYRSMAQCVAEIIPQNLNKFLKGMEDLHKQTSALKTIPLTTNDGMQW